MNFRDNVEHTISSGGTGALTLGAATVNSQAFVTGDNGLLFPYVIREGSAIETGRGIYTHSGTSFARTVREFSSTGSALSVSTSATLFVDANRGVHEAIDLALQPNISGGLITKSLGGNTLDITVCNAFVPAAGRVVQGGAVTAQNAGTLGASQWNQVYLTEAGAFEVVNNANPPSSAYAGNARQGGTGGLRRWIGSFLTDASNNIISQQSIANSIGGLSVSYLAPGFAAPFLVVNDIVLAAYNTTPLSLAGIAPAYVCSEVFGWCLMSAASAVIGTFYHSLDGVNDYSFARSENASATPGAAFWAAVLPTTPAFFYHTDTNSIYIKITGYKASR